jgi:hypothetical protein
MDGLWITYKKAMVQGRVKQRFGSEKKDSKRGKVETRIRVGVVYCAYTCTNVQKSPIWTGNWKKTVG